MNDELPTNPNKSEKYNHRAAGTEPAPHVNPAEKSDAQKRLEETEELRDVPFPGDDALGP